MQSFTQYVIYHYLTANRSDYPPQAAPREQMPSWSSGWRGNCQQMEGSFARFSSDGPSMFPSSRGHESEFSRSVGASRTRIRRLSSTIRLLVQPGDGVTI